MVKHVSWKRKPWKVEWKNPWTKALRVRWFDSEAEAVAFENAQQAICAREPALINARPLLKLFGTRWENVLLDAGVIYMPCACKSRTTALAMLKNAP